MQTHHKRQHGAVLVVSLMIMVILMLLATSSINMSTVNLRIVDNMRTQIENDTAVHYAMDEVRSSLQPFGGVANADPATPLTINVNGRDVVITSRRCVRAQIVQGNELTITPGSSSQEDTYWEYTGTYTDPQTNAPSIQHQGMTVVIPGGNC